MATNATAIGMDPVDDFYFHLVSRNDDTGVIACDTQLTSSNKILTMQTNKKKPTVIHFYDGG
jgi:hypothetical protein